MICDLIIININYLLIVNCLLRIKQDVSFQDDMLQ